MSEGNGKAAIELPDDFWITTGDAAKLLRCSNAGVRRLVHLGHLRADARGGRGCLMFRLATVTRFAAERASLSRSGGS